ncbi:von Willebrand factor type A domain protein [Aciduliprofundum boonei T469]|nr:von Willebrand factor type A domain protein [Aciduliprofundum boonei T469]
MNVENIMKEVSSEFGKVMPLKIVDDAPSAYFDWESVTLPKRFLDWDDEMIKNVLRHEFGHLFFSPRNPDVGVVINYIASLFGYENPWLFTNILTDLIVDTTNMEVFGEEYLRFLERSIEKADKGRTLRAMAGVYHEKAEKLNLKTSLPKNHIGKEIYKILNNNETDFYLRVIEIAKLFLPYYDFQTPLHFRILIFSDGSPAEIAKSLIKVKVGSDVMDELRRLAGERGGFLLSDPVMVAYEKMKIVSTYLELEESMEGMESKQINYGPWSIGDEPYELDMTKTLTSYGIVLPGVYSTKSESIDMGNEREGKSYRDSMIILDCSGSMEGEPFERAREAAYVMAREIQKAGKKVGLIPFSGYVIEDRVVYPTTDSSRLNDILARIKPRGGTMLQYALQFALQFGKEYYVYILSDSDVYDVRSTEELLDEFRGRCTFFLITYEEVNRWFEKDGIKIVEISPDGIVKRAYEEVKK